MDIVVTLEFASRLDTFPRRRNLDQDTVLFNTDRLVESYEFLCLKIKNEDGIYSTNKARVIYLRLCCFLVE